MLTTPSEALPAFGRNTCKTFDADGDLRDYLALSHDPVPQRSITMKITALEYHDVVPRGAYASSGMRTVGADRYKLERLDFEQHLSAIRETGTNPREITQVLSNQASIDSFVLTFDDGGASALHISEVLEDF